MSLRAPSPASGSFVGLDRPTHFAMPITDAQKNAAQAVQEAAAHDTAAQVRLVAGPGTGKSQSIEERICWLIREGVPAESICAVSFTRASATDLRLRVHRFAAEPGYDTIDGVRVTTLHSLALRVLREAGQLDTFPVEPLVMDDWEVENIFDEEFAQVHNVGKKRREQIRRDHEAFWSTGTWDPPNYIPPNPAITPGERNNFDAFHGPRTETYACVLPGHIIRLCVEQMEAGLLNAVDLLGLRHLIVDEYQDLNPLDQRFVRFLIQQGARVFIAGDDDQSIYSFRFASPAGIQNFPADYPGSTQHQLNACFRCAPEVLHAAATLIAARPGLNRIPKAHTSLYAASDPPVPGRVHCWRFQHATAEARAVAHSCRDLIAAGTNPRDILILLSKKSLSNPLLTELEAAGVPAEHPREEGFRDTNAGRLALYLLRIVCNADDYIAHRAILCLRRGVGIGRCIAVYDAVVGANMNFRAAFYDSLPAGVFTGHALTCINHARTTCAAMNGWQTTDTLGVRGGQIGQLIEGHFNAAAVPAWQAFTENLPPDMTLQELRDFLWADSDEQQAGILQAAMVRLGMDIPDGGVLPPRVRVMTMHGAKGLSGHVVFIPGLEDEVFPGPYRTPYPGLVLEAARLLYVSITRARAACVVSLARRRVINGQLETQTPSRFATDLGGPFADRTNGMSADEVNEVRTFCGNLF
jgi:DNA helicase II / ATP-dependent DNA helicase PcrA